MIHSKFAALLGDRLLKISKVAAGTGISRATLTDLYYRRGQGIRYDTLDALCKYLGCGVGDIIEYRPDPPEGGGNGGIGSPRAGAEKKEVCMKAVLYLTMPESCGACPLHQDSDTGVAIYCGPLSTPRAPAIVGASHAGDDSGYVGYRARHADCPLVPVETEAAR